MADPVVSGAASGEAEPSWRNFDQRRGVEDEVGLDQPSVFLQRQGARLRRLTKTQFGWRIDLSATGSLPLDNGPCYEAWLKSAAGILVPLETFNDRARDALVPVSQ